MAVATPQHENTYKNALLAGLPAEHLALLEPHLCAEDLPLRKQLEARNKPIEHVYFIESGIASVVANGVAGRSIEVCIIGREGMSGIALLMGKDHAAHETYMQIAGSGLRMPADKLQHAIEKSPSLHRALLQYAHAFMTQVAQTALANGRNKIEERLARWLLMASDRIGGPELTLTHEFLAVMLGVRRPGVTVALNLVENAGLITLERGVIRIVDREGLEETSNGAYGPTEAMLRPRPL